MRLTGSDTAQPFGQEKLDVEVMQIAHTHQTTGPHISVYFCLFFLFEVICLFVCAQGSTEVNDHVYIFEGEHKGFRGYIISAIDKGLCILRLALQCIHNNNNKAFIELKCKLTHVCLLPCRTRKECIVHVLDGTDREVITLDVHMAKATAPE